MTNEEKIAELINIRDNFNYTLAPREVFDEAIKALEQQSKSGWVPVSERLPEESITVIGTTEFDDIYKAELYDDCGEKKWYANGNFDVPIVAWMPLPEPYRAASEG